MVKMKTTAFTEMILIQKQRKILPNRDRRFKDKSPIFLNINMSQKV
jgi:hypothetical protein